MTRVMQTYHQIKVMGNNTFSKHWLQTSNNSYTGTPTITSIHLQLRLSKKANNMNTTENKAPSHQYNSWDHPLQNPLREDVHVFGFYELLALTNSQVFWESVFCKFKLFMNSFTKYWYTTLVNTNFSFLNRKSFLLDTIIYNALT